MGRATCAIGLAFKPIQIGQSWFHDDGVGTFNPAPEALDEALVNEWPGREMGVFVSVGTGRRPRNSDASQQMWYEGLLGDFADARRRLIAKIEGCEDIDEYMLNEHLPKRGVNPENYYRLNVEIGVGEFGMNEWHRLGDISTGSRRYMAQESEQRMIQDISTKLAKIQKAKLRWERAALGIPQLVKSSTGMEPGVTLAVELPADMPTSFPAASHSPISRSSFESGSDSLHVGAKKAVAADVARPRSADGGECTGGRARPAHGMRPDAGEVPHSVGGRQDCHHEPRRASETAARAARNAAGDADRAPASTAQDAAAEQRARLAARAAAVGRQRGEGPDPPVPGRRRGAAAAGQHGAKTRVPPQVVRHQRGG